MTLSKRGGGNEMKKKEVFKRDSGVIWGDSEGDPSDEGGEKKRKESRSGGWEKMERGMDNQRGNNKVRGQVETGGK